MIFQLVCRFHMLVIHSMKSISDYSPGTFMNYKVHRCTKTSCDDDVTTTASEMVEITVSIG